VGTHFGGQCAARGMLVRVAGDIIMISPPLIISKSEIEFVRSQNSLCLNVVYNDAVDG